jgi:hypothetical protein
MTHGEAAHDGVDRDKGTEFRDCAAQWAIQQCEPLIPGATRLSTEARLVELTTDAPRRTAAWLGGTLADQVQTLPPDDPWRNLSARLGNLTHGNNPPEQDAAAGAGRPFGTVADGTDLIPASFPSPMTDVGLAGLGNGLSPVAAAVLAFAADGWGRCSEALTVVHGQLMDDGASVAAAGLVATGGDALRWALWRRRVYAGPQEDWFLASAFSWVWRAEQIAGTGALPGDELAEIDAALEDEAIDPTAYRVLVDTSATVSHDPESHS